MKDWYLGITGTIVIGMLSWTALSIITIQQDVAVIKEQIATSTVNLSDEVDNLRATTDALTVNYNNIFVTGIDQGKRIVRVETVLESMGKGRY